MFFTQQLGAILILVCSDGLYKGEAGDGQCKKCGANSETSRDGRTCLCNLGFSRDLSKEDISSSECKKCKILSFKVCYGKVNFLNKRFRHLRISSNLPTEE